MQSVPKLRSHNQTAGNADHLTIKLGPISYRAPGDLRSYKRKLRKHSERQLVQLEASIREFGFVLPVLVDPTGEIVAGEARVEAARRTGMVEVPTLSIEHLSPAQIKAYRLADNRLAEHSSWDEELLAIELAEIIDLGEVGVELLGWETAQVDVLLDGASDADRSSDPADVIPAPPADPVTRAGDLWCLGQHRLLCASSLEPANWERLMAGQTAAMAFTDAPYNVPIQGHVSGLGQVRHEEFAMASGEMSESEFTAFLTRFLTAMSAHLADGAVIHACMDHKHLFELQTAARAANLSALNLCVWNKTNGGMGSLYRSKHELVLVLKKGRAPHQNHVQLGKHGRYRTNVWDYPGVNTFSKSRMQDLTDHPTVKPTALITDAIRDVSRTGDIVLDAFMGSGTTILAAERSKRVAYGIEIEPKYVDVAIRRWEAMAESHALLGGTGESLAEVRSRRAAERGAESDDLPADVAPVLLTTAAITA
jgi:hypothetical protein